MSRVLILALAGGFTLLQPGGPRVPSEEEAVAIIKKLEGTVTRDDTRPGQPVIAVNL